MKLFWILFSLFLFSCATVQRPEGGDRDRVPPMILWEQSTPEFQTNFTPTELSFQFDEWVQLPNGGRGIIISPKLEKKPSISLKKRTLVIQLHDDEVLKENTTYLLQFNDEVVDLTERNPLTQQYYVFSTGDYIDSLSITGRVVDVLDPAPLHNVICHLYDSIIDTPAYFQKPEYITKADSSGQFRFHHLKDHDWHLFAFRDLNKNGSYDPYTEVAYVHDTTINPIRDSVLSYPIMLSKERHPMEVIHIDSSARDHALFRFSRMTGNDLQVSSTNAHSITSSAPSDRLEIVYLDSIWPKTFVFRSDLEEYYDTIQIFSPKEKTIAKLTLDHPATKKHFGHHKGLLELTFSRHICVLDPSRIVLQQRGDSSLLLIEPSAALLDSCRTLWTIPLRSTIHRDSVYTLSIYPGATQDVYRDKNEDTLRHDFVYRGPQEQEKTELHVTLRGLDTLSPYLIILDNKTYSESKVLNKGTEEELLVFRSIPRGIYDIFVVVDLDVDGLWTPFSWQQKTKCEPIMKYEVPEIREGWITDFEINIK